MVFALANWRAEAPSLMDLLPSSLGPGALRRPGQTKSSPSSINYTYDSKRLTQVTDATGTYGFPFDNMGRLIGTTTAYTAVPSQTFAIGYSYDAASNRVGFTDPQGRTISYGYDSLNRATDVTDSLAGHFGFGYDTLGRRSSLSRPNGVATQYGYDSLSRLLSALHKNAGGATLDGAGYGYDLAGNRSSRTDAFSGAAATYQYDKLYELTKAVTITGGALIRRSFSTIWSATAWARPLRPTATTRRTSCSPRLTRPLPTTPTAISLR